MASIIKPVLRGREIKRFEISYENNYIILARDGIDIPHKYPAVYKHLSNFQSELEKRGDKGKFWYNLRPCSYYDKFEQTKIILPDISNHVNFTLDTCGYFLTNTCYFLPTEYQYLTAILNSKVAEFFYRHITASIRGGFMRFFEQYLKQIPIPNINIEIQEMLLGKVNQLLKLNSEKQELNKQALEVLRAEYKLSKVTQKLEKFLTLGWNEFIEELEKQKVRIDLSQKDKLNTWFRSKQSEAKQLIALTEKLEREIDKAVYKLYNLNDAEIKVIEMDNKH